MLLYSKFRASIKLLSSIILPASSIKPLKWPYLDTIMVKERSSERLRAGQVTIGMKSQHLGHLRQKNARWAVQQDVSVITLKVNKLYLIVFTFKIFFKLTP